MNSTTLFHKNIIALQQRNAHTYRWLSSHKDRLEGLEKRIIENRHGALDWRLPSGQGLFDRMAPGWTYRDWVTGNVPDTSATLVVGSNLGYGVNHLLRGLKDSHRIWVLEPRPDVLAACLSQTDYRPFLESGRLVFLPPQEDILRQMVWQLDVEYIFGKVYVLADVPSYQIGPEYARWAERCKSILDAFGADLNTMRKNQDTMIQNELANYDRALEDGDLSLLREQGCGISAVIYGAGPSLDQFGPMIAQHQGSALHACALQTMPALYRIGLKPHFCMAIDYSPVMKQVCKGLDRRWAQNIPLIYSRKVDPEAVRSYPGPTLPIWTVGGIGTFMPREREVVLNGGGSVGVALQRFLTWCGVRRILLVGYDFSWRKEKTHVSGHLSSGGGFTFHPDRHIIMKNMWGETIYSENAYITALEDLERDLRETPGEVWNLYGGGTRITGASEVSYEEAYERGRFISQDRVLENFLDLLKQARRPRQRPTFEIRSTQWAHSIKAVKNRLETLFKGAGNREGEIKAVLHQIVKFLNQDPLYKPYLFNEILEMAYLVRRNTPVRENTLKRCLDILERVVKKVTEIDDCVAVGKRLAA